MGLIIYLLAVYGFANAVAVLHVGQPIRALAARIGPRFTNEHNGKVTTWPAVLAGCVACLGFWVGAFISYFDLLASPALPYVAPGQYARINAAVVDGFMACAFNYGCHWANQLVYAAQDLAKSYAAYVKAYTQVYNPAPAGTAPGAPCGDKAAS